METPGRSYVYMKINTGATIPSQVIIELFDDIAPKTCENFRQLCKKFKPQGGTDTIGYESTEVHRVVRGMYVQAGDVFKAHGKYNRQRLLILPLQDSKQQAIPTMAVNLQMRALK